MKLLVVACLVIISACLVTCNLQNWAVRFKPLCAGGLCFGKRSTTLTACGSQYPEKISDYDKNGDELISLTELAAATNCPVKKSRAAFSKADKNGDGFIDDNEFQFSDLNSGQKIEKSASSYDEVGEIIRDATEYFNKHGKNDIEVKISKDVEPSSDEESQQTEESEESTLRELKEMFEP